MRLDSIENRTTIGRSTSGKRTMSIETELSDELKDAMRAKDQRRLDVIRAVKTELGRKITEPGFDGVVDDDVYRAVIDSFVKKVKKSQVEYGELGDRGREMADRLAFEAEYLSRWLPQKMDEGATRQLVAEAIAELGLSDPGDKGRLMGHLMKSHKDDLDGQLVNQIVTEALAGA